MKNLPESLIQERNYEQEPFLQRLAQHRDQKLKNESPLEYFDDMNIPPLVLGDSCSHNLRIYSHLFILLCLNSEEMSITPFHKLLSSFLVKSIPSEITNNSKSHFLHLMNELFEVIGPPRNYDLRAQDGRHRDSSKAEKRIRTESASPSLWEERRTEEEKQRAEKAEDWVGSTAAQRSGWVW